MWRRQEWNTQELIWEVIKEILTLHLAFRKPQMVWCFWTLHLTACVYVFTCSGRSIIHTLDSVFHSSLVLSASRLPTHSWPHTHTHECNIYQMYQSFVSLSPLFPEMNVTLKSENERVIEMLQKENQVYLEVMEKKRGKMKETLSGGIFILHFCISVGSPCRSPGG